jgi:DNA invertase Pin-like site-specific DNA recombinase
VDAHGARKVWRETASGAKADRVQLAASSTGSTPATCSWLTRLDRLARSTRDLLILATIAEKKAGFRPPGDTCVDTTTSHGRLMLDVLGGLAQV